MFVMKQMNFVKPLLQAMPDKKPTNFYGGKDNGVILAPISWLLIVMHISNSSE